MSALQNFHFLHPAWLLALLPLVALAIWAARRDRDPDGAWARLIDAHLLPALRLSRAGRGFSPWLFVGLAWVLGALALAGPAWQLESSNGYRAPASWVLLLDLSPSMSAGDLAPDRATRARFAVADLLNAAQDARVALVVFAGEPYTVTPLTTDVATVRTLLEPLSPRLMPESGHDVAPALIEALRLLRAGHAARGQVVVLADGFDDDERALLTAASLARQGVTVNVVGIGTTSGAPRRDSAGNFVRNELGSIMVSRMRGEALRQLAAAGGGRFVTLAGLPSLLDTLHAARAYALDVDFTRSGTVLAKWRNEGVWLLLPMLLLVGLLARRGWL
ncbi:MAG: VWA domain-containing protein [Steroidobacteraceae bacterium]